MTKLDQLKQMMGVRLEADAAHSSQTIGVQAMQAAKVIDIDRIVADENQPRRDFDDDELTALAGSLRDHGQTDPVKVRWDATRDRWILIDGERRWRAAQRMGIKSLSAIVEARPLSSDRILEVQLIENALRLDLSAVEAGAAYRHLMAVWNVNQTVLAKRLHISESKVSRALAALDLPVEVKAAVEARKVGAVAAVQKARAKPKTSKAVKPTRITTPAGIVVITPKAGRSVVDVLVAALDAERKRGAA
jgi:ParB family chromosome partitioning protein